MANPDNWDYYNGEHWRYWIGPTLPLNTPDYAVKMAQLERVFQSANLIAECVDNWRDGLISEPFTWQIKDANGERVKASQAEVELQRWLDHINQQAIASDSAESDPWSEFVLSLGVSGEGNLRLWQPDRYSNDPDPIKRIHLHAPKDGSVNVERGDDGFVDKISYVYGKGETEAQTMDGAVLVVQDGDQTLRIDTGGRWTIQQVKGRSLLTNSVKRLQNSLNHALTMMLRNQEIAGFRERVFLNAQPPGSYDANGNFVPSVSTRGPGIDQYIYGVETGTDGYTTPSVFEAEPVPIATLKESIDVYVRLLYRQFRQSYRFQAAEGVLSGESRIQQRQEFELFLRGWQRKIESAIANILNIVIRLLGYQDLEVVVSLNITTGKLTAEERTQLIAENQAGLLSDATAIARLGTVDDVDAELSLIEEERRQGTTPPPNRGEPDTTDNTDNTDTTEDTTNGNTSNTTNE